MKTLSFEQIENIHGGDWKGAVSWSCASVGVWAVLGGPISAPIAIFCAGWAVGSMLA